MTYFKFKLCTAKIYNALNVYFSYYDEKRHCNLLITAELLILYFFSDCYFTIQALSQKNNNYNLANDLLLSSINSYEYNPVRDLDIMEFVFCLRKSCPPCNRRCGMV